MSIKRQTVTVSPCGFSADFYKALKDFTIEVVQKDCIRKEGQVHSTHQPVNPYFKKEDRLLPRAVEFHSSRRCPTKRSKK
jgi:hypothetical protein